MRKRSEFENLRRKRTNFCVVLPNNLALKNCQRPVCRPRHRWDMARSWLRGWKFSDFGNCQNPGQDDFARHWSQYRRPQNTAIFMDHCPTIPLVRWSARARSLSARSHLVTVILSLPQQSIAASCVHPTWASSGSQ